MKRSLVILFALLLLSLTRLAAQMTCLTNNIAAGQPVMSSFPSGASNVVDGNTSTIWQPTVSGNGWIYVDLGQNYTLCKVVLLWTPWQSQDTFQVQFSADTTTWTTLASNTAFPALGPTGSNYQSHTIDVSASGMSGRYLRLYFPNMVAWNAQLEEVQVYNEVPLNLPVVSLTAPADGANYTEGDSVVLQATASETGGTISQVQFYQGTTMIGTSTSAPYKYTWKLVPEGEYVVTAKAIDAYGSSTASGPIDVFVDYPNPAWSLTGNSGTNGDSDFVGTIDSMKLDFRTKDLKRMTISANGNIGIGVDTPSAQLHTTGTVRLAGLTNDSTKTRVLVSDSSGNISYRSYSSVTGSGGGGVGLEQLPGGLALGDSVAGSGPHNFTSNRYQFLNSFLYSIGGTVNDPVQHPVFQTYDNGDVVAGTTMDRSVTTTDQSGFRYYSKLGILQLGATDRLDTTVPRLVYNNYQGAGILLNSDDANIIKGRIYNSVFAGNSNTIDSAVQITASFSGGGGIHYGTFVSGSAIVGAGHQFTGTGGVRYSLVSGLGQSLPYQTYGLITNGFDNYEQDSSDYSLINGWYNAYGGVGQFVSGGWLVNRTPFGTTLGNSNVDFATLGYPGSQLLNPPSGIAQYPLFALGNGNNSSGSVRSNAVTVLYNGRTQINTTGFSNALTQTAVTPKAALEVVSTNSGVLLPKLTTHQRDSIVSGDLQNGLLLYNTDSSQFQFYNGSSWSGIGSGGSNSSGAWSTSGNAGTNPASNFLGTTDNQPLIFKTNGVKSMTILSNGSVVVGDTALPASDAMFAVKGTVYAQKVKVTLTGWPDYVFNRNYKLTGLPEIEQYIKWHQHLPGVASAGEIEKNGLDVGDNQAALMKKVEELTLYLIDEYKKRKQQDDQLKEQDKKMEEQQRQLQEQHQQLSTLQQQIDELKKMIQNKNQ